MSRVRIGLITGPDEKVGRDLARTLVEERLAACVNIISGVRSVYRWEGKIEDDPEVLLVVKTTTEKADLLIDRVAELHPYDLPEVLILEVEKGLPGYLSWVAQETDSA